MDEDFNEDIVDLVTQMSLAEHYPLHWDVDRLDDMRELILSYGVQVQEYYQLHIEGIAGQQVGYSIRSMSSQSSRDSGDSSYCIFSSALRASDTNTDPLRYSSGSADATVGPAVGIDYKDDKGKDTIQQLRTKLLWYQKSIMQEIRVNSSSGFGNIDHVSAMIFHAILTAMHDIMHHHIV